MARQTFFEHAVLESELGHHLFQIAILSAKVLDLIAGRFANRVSGELLLAALQKVLAPPVVEIGGDAFPTTELGDALLAPQTLEHDQDFSSGANFLRVLRRISRTAASPDCFFFVIPRLSLGF
jgi:hypothetical protein